jgi:ornithine decarboxylase
MLAPGAALASIAPLVRALRAEGIELDGINLGGGLPAGYVDTAPELNAYAEAIMAAVGSYLGPRFHGRLLIEPGRFLVGDAGVLRSEVVLISRKPTHPDRRWVYLDVGLFNGLTEALGEAIRYRLRVGAYAGEPEGPVVLAGPSCDSTDVLYESHPCRLPLALQVGDVVDVLAAGAYTTAYSSVWFNGFEPPATYIVG